MEIKKDGSVSADLTGARAQFDGEHGKDVWGRRQVVLTLSTWVMASEPPHRLGPVAHVKINAGDIPDLIAQLQSEFDEAKRLYAEEGESSPGLRARAERLGGGA